MLSNALWCLPEKKLDSDSDIPCCCPNPTPLFRQGGNFYSYTVMCPEALFLPHKQPIWCGFTRRWNPSPRSSNTELMISGPSKSPDADVHAFMVSSSSNVSSSSPLMGISQSDVMCSASLWTPDDDVCVDTDGSWIQKHTALFETDFGSTPFQFQPDNFGTENAIEARCHAISQVGTCWVKLKFKISLYTLSPYENLREISIWECNLSINMSIRACATQQKKRQSKILNNLRFEGWSF